MAERVIIDRAGGVVHVRLNRPEKRNALDGPMFESLVSTARDLASDHSVRAVVLSGAGGCFCSGLDLSNLGDMAAGDLDAGSEEVRQAASQRSADGANRAQQVAWLWQEMGPPVIAAVEGAAYGGGFHIALGADIRFIAPSAKIAFVEITWGLVPDLSGTQALRRLVPLDVAKKLVLSGEPIDGRRAVELHLGTELSDDPVASALELAERISGYSPDAVRAAKRLLNRSALVPLAQGLANEFDESAALMGTPNQIEAVMSKLEGRAPAFADPD